MTQQELNTLNTIIDMLANIIAKNNDKPNLMREQIKVIEFSSIKKN